MARPAQTEEQRRATRRKIRDAAAALYAEQGIGNITARAVAERAGVSVGTLYSYFDNLTELMQSLWRQPVRKLVADLEQAAADARSPSAGLRHLLSIYVAFAARETAVFRGAFLYVRPTAIAPPPQVETAGDRFFATFQTTITQGQQAGIFRQGDPAQITQTVLSAVHGALAMPVNMHRLALADGQQRAGLMIDTMLEWIEQV